MTQKKIPTQGYNPLDRLLTFDTTVARPTYRFVRKAKVFLMTLPTYQRQVVRRWTSGTVVDSTRTFKSEKQALASSQRIVPGHMVMVCWYKPQFELLDHFVIAVGMTNDARVDASNPTMVHTSWTVIASIQNWKPFDEPVFSRVPQIVRYHIMKSVTKDCWMSTIPKFWSTELPDTKTPETKEQGIIALVKAAFEQDEVAAAAFQRIQHV